MVELETGVTLEEFIYKFNFAITEKKNNYFFKDFNSDIELVDKYIISEKEESIPVNNMSIDDLKKQGLIDYSDDDYFTDEELEDMEDISTEMNNGLMSQAEDNITVTNEVNSTAWEEYTEGNNVLPEDEDDGMDGTAFSDDEDMDGNAFSEDEDDTDDTAFSDDDEDDTDDTAFYDDDEAED